MIEAVGWLGSILFSICALPQVWKTWKTKSAGDLSWLFLLAWFGGELFTAIYVLADPKLPLLTNYAVNGACVVYLIWAKYAYR